MKIYLASSWRNAYQATVLAELRELGFEVYDFKNPTPGDHGFSWKQCIDGPIDDCAKMLRALRSPVAVRGFEFNHRAMCWADICVLLLPCGNSAHLEAGKMSGWNKPVVVLCPELREPELMYKEFDHGEETPMFVSVAEATPWLRILAGAIEGKFSLADLTPMVAL
jgi:hypothetical protein